MITCSISGRGHAPEKVTSINLFYLRSIDRGTTNVSYLLAQYLFRHAEGRKSGTRLSEGYFIGQLATHFGQVSDEGLRARGLEREPDAMAGAPEAAEDAPAVDEGAQADLAPVQDLAVRKSTILHTLEKKCVKLVRAILTPYQHTFAQELKLENHPEKHIRGVPRSNSISHFL
ncbi:hypothetical protein Tco_0009115 [Tanacetum coccineum]